MKVAIELDDATLHRAIKNQVGKAIAALTDEHITARVNEILQKKFSRVDDAVIAVAIGKAAAELVRSPNGVHNTYSLHSRIDKALGDAARSLLREDAKTR